MRRFHYGEIALEAPPKWTDLSVVTLTDRSEQTAEEGAPSVSLTRESAAGKTPLETLARRLVTSHAKTVKAHAVVDEGPAEIDGGPAFRSEQRFETRDKIALHQLQYFFATPVGDVALLSFTCAVDRIDAHRSLFESIARSVRRESVDA
ncbi:MAG: DcrB-related protein [Deltaproteobacteria bacterium]